LLEFNCLFTALVILIYSSGRGSGEVISLQQIWASDGVYLKSQIVQSSKQMLLVEDNISLSIVKDNGHHLASEDNVEDNNDMSQVVNSRKESNAIPCLSR
jgi:hypothetical protein